MVERVMTTPIGTPDHHGSHRNLLWESGPSAPWPTHAQVDAIVVPTVRSPAYLSNAARLATQLGCTLVTLHSGKWTSAVAAARRLPRELSLIAIDVPDKSALRLMDFETSRILTGTIFARRTDTSLKRNLALLLSKLIGWQRIVFLDDDIRGPSVNDLSRAADLLSIYNAVGMSVGGFPDNSVVCHAYRAVGGPQESFIGGGALAVEIARNRSFFPDIYNEDWFYLLDPIKGLQPLAVAGSVVQGIYDPFRNDERARSEEFGDVLAEGIFWLLDQGRSLHQADIGHWRDFIERRRRFIRHVLALVNQAAIEPSQRARMGAALRASLGRLSLIEPDWCQKYLNAWMADRVGWEHQLQGLPGAGSAEAAVRSLARKGSRPLSYVIQGPLARTRPPRAVLAGAAMPVITVPAALAANGTSQVAIVPAGLPPAPTAAAAAEVACAGVPAAV
jgi:hypothetical protein